jgi:hypothetical protein
MVKSKLCPYKASTFSHLQKKFQKITMKIDIIGTCLNFQLSLVRDFGPLGVNSNIHLTSYGQKKVQK